MHQFGFKQDSLDASNIDQRTGYGPQDHGYGPQNSGYGPGMGLRIMISARANGSIVLVNGPTTTKFRHDNLLTSQNNFPTSLENFTPSSNNTTTFSYPSGNGRINGASKLHCCYELITEGPKFPSEHRFGSRMLIQSSPTILVTVPSSASKIARSARLRLPELGFTNRLMSFIDVFAPFERRSIRTKS